MKKKTFFTTMLLFLLFFNGAFLFLAVVFWHEKLDVQKEMALSEHYMILTSAARDMQALDSRGNGGNYNMEELMQPYTQFRQDGHRSLYLYHGGQLLYSDETKRTGKDAENALAPSLKESGQREIRMVKEKKETGEYGFLYVEGCFPQPYEDYSLIYKYSLKDIYENWREMKNLLFLCGGVFSLLLSLCLIALLNRLFHPLQQIAETSREMTSGDFNGRLPEKGRDEVAAMAHSFNQMAETIKTQIAELEEAAAQKQRLVDNFAHELRTPLTAIYGYAEYLQKAAVSEEDKVSSAGYIMSQCRRLSNLSQQLLELSALREERGRLGKIQVDKLFYAVKQTILPKAESRGVAVSFEAKLEELKGNRDLLESLLINLIDNGIKACDSGGTVRVSAYFQGRHPALAVADNGRGIPEKAISQIKEPFYRVDKARSRKEGGAGLGLSICEQIAQVHQAQLQIGSAPGKGTVIRIIFPEI